MRALAPIAEVAVARQVFLTERLLYRQWCIGRHCWVCVCMGVCVGGWMNGLIGSGRWKMSECEMILVADNESERRCRWRRGGGGW